MQTCQKSAILALIVFLIFGLTGCAGGPNTAAPPQAAPEEFFGPPAEKSAKKAEQEAEKISAPVVKLGDPTAPKKPGTGSAISSPPVALPAPGAVKTEEDLYRDLYRDMNGVSWWHITRHLEKHVLNQSSMSLEEKHLRYTEALVLYVFPGIMVDMPLPMLHYAHSTVASFPNFSVKTEFGNYTKEIAVAQISKIAKRDYKSLLANKDSCSASQLGTMSRFIVSSFALTNCGFSAAMSSKMTAEIDTVVNAQKLRCSTAITGASSITAYKEAVAMKQFLIKQAVNSHWCASDSKNMERMVSGYDVPGYNRASQILTQYARGDYASGEKLNACQIPVSFINNWKSPWAPTSQPHISGLYQLTRKNVNVYLAPEWGGVFARINTEGDRAVTDPVQIQRVINKNNADLVRNAKFSGYIDLSAPDAILIRQTKSIWPKEFFALVTKVAEERKKRAVKYFGLALEMRDSEIANVIRLLLTKEYIVLIEDYQYQREHEENWYWDYSPQMRKKRASEVQLRKQLTQYLEAAKLAVAQCKSTNDEIKTIVGSRTESDVVASATKCQTAFDLCKAEHAKARTAAEQKNVPKCQKASNLAVAQIAICERELRSAKSLVQTSDLNKCNSLVKQAIKHTAEAHGFASQAKALADKKTSPEAKTATTAADKHAFNSEQAASSAAAAIPNLKKVRGYATRAKNERDAAKTEFKKVKAAK